MSMKEPNGLGDFLCIVFWIFVVGIICSFL